MAEAESNLEALIALRKQERDQEQAERTRELARRVEAALGGRVMEAMAASGDGGWELDASGALRRFAFRKGDFILALRAVPGAPRVEVELRHADRRFDALAKRAEISELGEDWFLDAVDMLASQVQARIQSPKNFA